MRAVFENIIHDQSSSIHLYEYNKKDFETPLHFHPEYELVYIIEGKGTRYVGDNVSEFVEGDLVLLAPNVNHCWKNYKHFSGQCRSLVIQWKEGLLGNQVEYEPLKMFLQKSRRGLRFKKPGKLLSQLMDLQKEEGLGRILSLISLLNVLSSEVEVQALSSGFQMGRRTLKNNERLDKLYEFVEHNYQQRISLEQAAAEVHMTKEAFARFFKKHTNKTFFTYLNEFRIARACRMIKESDCSVTQLCFDNGFESLAYFHRMFKQLKAATPLQYKKKLQRSVLK